jgi:hypothetical protein
MVGAYTRVAWVSFRGFDERGVAGLPAAVAGLCCGSAAALLCLPHRWAVRGGLPASVVSGGCGGYAFGWFGSRAG